MSIFPKLPKIEITITFYKTLTAKINPINYYLIHDEVLGPREQSHGVFKYPSCVENNWVFFLYQGCDKKVHDGFNNLFQCSTASDSDLASVLENPLSSLSRANPESRSLVQPLQLVQVDSGGNFEAMPDLSRSQGSGNPDQVIVVKKCLDNQTSSRSKAPPH